MKRSVTQLSRSAADTPLLPRFDKKCKGESVFGTPVDGLTDMPVDTPESQQRQRLIPDTTQRKLEGFCLNTPLTLSQAHGAETPTLIREPQAAKSLQAEQAAAAAMADGCGLRHRLANISNLPASPGSAAAAPDSCGFAPDNQQPQDGAYHLQVAANHRQQMQAQPLSAKQQLKKSRHHVHFATGLFSPPATLPGLADEFAFTPHHASLAGASVISCPGSGGDDGFVLHMSQTYSRASQPAISPNIAAGLSAPRAETGEAADEAGVSTTPSQDSKEPCMQSPSNITFSNAVGAVCHQDDPAADARLPLLVAADAADVPTRYGSNTSTTTAFDQLTTGSDTPGDALAAQLPCDLEETTTPELEQIGYSSQDFFTNSQHSAGGAAGCSKGRGGAAAAGGTGPSGSRGCGVVCEEVTAKQMMFPIFRPKAQRKCVILIRHGESEYNSRDARSKNWSDPTCYDAPLTDKGRGQARKAIGSLVELLRRHKDKGSSLWLSSPLTRALDTMMLAYPEVQLLAKGQLGDASTQNLASQPCSHRVMVLSTIAEQCITVGDVGRPASHLMQQFPALNSQLSQLPEKWWFDPCPEKPNCATTKQFNRKESKDELRCRVSEFSRWLASQPEQLVIAFGHSIFWQRFANMPNKLKNCEVHQFWF